MEYMAAIWLGLLGSLHCVGMCGPIALSLPVTGSRTRVVTGVLLYNAGRIATYALMGSLFGLVGKSFVLAGLQQVLSVLLGVTVLFFVLLPDRFKQNNRVGAFIYRKVYWVKRSLSHLFRVKARSALFLIGLLNGLLPCGLVYLAIAGAVAAGNPLGGAATMALFGLGTLPLMISVALTKEMIKPSLRHVFRKVVPYFVSAMAILLVLRGLNLNIPYLSPALSKSQTLECCAAKKCKP